MGTTVLTTLPKQFTLEPVKSFKIGDVICKVKDFKNRNFNFFEATEYDVKKFSGVEWYYKVSPISTGI